MSQDKIIRTRKLTVIVSRYNEDLEWILSLPDDARIIVYNKGGDISLKPILDRVDKLVHRPNCGRESETYLNHTLACQDTAEDDEWWVFTQGDPFPTAPILFS